MTCSYVNTNERKRCLEEVRFQPEDGNHVRIRFAALFDAQNSIEKLISSL